MVVGADGGQGCGRIEARAALPAPEPLTPENRRTHVAASHVSSSFALRKRRRPARGEERNGRAAVLVNGWVGGGGEARVSVRRRLRPRRDARGPDEGALNTRAAGRTANADRDENGNEDVKRAGNWRGARRGVGLSEMQRASTAPISSRRMEASRPRSMHEVVHSSVRGDLFSWPQVSGLQRKPLGLSLPPPATCLALPACGLTKACSALA